jgi:LacI family transcriptional regulator
MPSPKSAPPPVAAGITRRIGVREVAERAGVHFTTVGLALRDSPRLPKATREKIQRIAHELGYRPDPRLAILNAYRQATRAPNFQSTLAWINNWPHREGLYKIPCFREYYEGACQRANELGYAIEEFWLRELGISERKLERIFKARGISGIIMAPQPTAGMSVDLDYGSFAAISLGYSLKPSILHVVSNHQPHTIKLAMDHVVELGYKRVGLRLSADTDEKGNNAYIAGLLLARWKYPQLQNASPLLTSVNAEEIKSWIIAEKLDIVISEDWTLGAMRTMGFKVPEDIGFVCLCVNRDEKEMSGVYQNNLAIGRSAVDLVASMLNRWERGVPEIPQRVLIESTWYPGATVRKQ